MSIQIKVDTGSEKLMQKIGRQPTLVGRSEKCHIVINDSNCSSIHCSLFVDDSGLCTVKDEESKNGIFINGEKVQLSRLYAEDVLTVGPARIFLETSMMTDLEKKNHIRDIKIKVKKHLELDGGQLVMGDFARLQQERERTKKYRRKEGTMTAIKRVRKLREAKRKERQGR